tara:strand:+ start:300 stop:473 length:174 start_codon:yes stop_codon:yes gene_type:complete
MLEVVGEDQRPGVAALVALAAVVVVAILLEQMEPEVVVVVEAVALLWPEWLVVTVLS